jgi:hypothetical protein
MECPTRPIGRSPKRSTIRSSAQRASANGDSRSSFHPRTAYRSFANAMRPPPARNTRRPKGIMRRTAGSKPRTEAKLSTNPPCRSRTMASGGPPWVVKLRRGTRSIRVKVGARPVTGLSDWLGLPERLNLAEVEVLERTTCRGPTLTLIARAVLGTSVRVLCWARQPEKAELADLHTGPELDRQGGSI